MPKTAGIIVIGNEILSGRTRDENTAFLLGELRRLGVEVRKVSIIPDVLEVVRDQVRSFSSDYDYVFTSGGVGPTHDDVTIAAIAAAFEQGIRRDDRLIEALTTYYQDRLNDRMLRMADVPTEAVLLGGADTLFPVVAVRNVYIFPGVPEILASKFARIREIFRESPYHDADVFLAVEEGEVAGTLDTLLVLFPELGLGSYPAFNRSDFKVKLTLESKDPAYLASALRSLLEALESQSIRPVEPASDHPAVSKRPG